MKIKRTKGEVVFDAAVYVIIALISLACLYPMLYVLFASLSDPVEIMFHSGGLLWPLGFSLEGYKAVIEKPDVWSGYGNTLFYVIVGTALNMVMTTIGAYALSRREFMLKKPLTMMIVFTMYFTGGTIPNFLLIRNLGLLDTRWALILPVAIGTWNLLVMRTAFASVPLLWRKPPSSMAPTTCRSSPGWFCRFPRPLWRLSSCSTPWDTGTPGSTP